MVIGNAYIDLILFNDYESNEDRVLISSPQTNRQLLSSQYIVYELQKHP